MNLVGLVVYWIKGDDRMKKIIGLLLVVAVIFGMCSCEPSAKYPKEITTLEEYREAFNYFASKEAYSVMYSIEDGFDITPNDGEPPTEEEFEESFAVIKAMGAMTWVEEGILRIDMYFFGSMHNFTCTADKLERAKELAMQNPCLTPTF